MKYALVALIIVVAIGCSVSVSLNGSFTHFESFITSLILGYGAGRLAGMVLFRCE